MSEKKKAIFHGKRQSAYSPQWYADNTTVCGIGVARHENCRVRVVNRYIGDEGNVCVRGFGMACVQKSDDDRQTLCRSQSLR